MIDWQTVLLNLRNRYKPLAQVAAEVGADEGTLCRLARGDTCEPKFSTGVKLLDLHLDNCPMLHRRDILFLEARR
jgi:hypothetical protein